MLRLHCPVCGLRPETEFQCAGEAIPRAAQPAELIAQDWTDALYNRGNVAGWVEELWWHSFGCRLWLLVERNTLDHQIRAVRRLSDAQESDAQDSDAQESGAER